MMRGPHDCENEWVSPGSLLSSTDITETLLKVVLMAVTNPEPTVKLTIQLEQVVYQTDEQFHLHNQLLLTIDPLNRKLNL